MSSSPTVRSGGFSSIAAGANDAFVPVVGRCFYRTLLRWRNNNSPATARLKAETMRVTLEEFSPAYDFFDYRGSVTVGVSFLVHSWCTITCK
jgi:hypothetical protein